MTSRGATLFLEAPLHFNESVEFHGNLSVIAVRQPLGGPCVCVEKDLVVTPGAELRVVNCRNLPKTPETYDSDYGYGYGYGDGGITEVVGQGGGMQVHGNLFIHGDLHIRNCIAVHGGSLGWNWSHTQAELWGIDWWDKDNCYHAENIDFQFTC